MRIAAVADLHVRAGDEDRLRTMFRVVKHEADILVLAGDLTDHGRPGEAESLVRGLHGIGVPVVTVLGNHDHEAGAHVDLMRTMESSGLHCLDKGSVVIDGVGFAGAKGFCGGFDDALVRGFGEDALKAFVSESIIDAETLRRQLKHLDTEVRVAVTHYAPIQETLEGEPKEIYPFLGTSRLAQSIDEGGAALAIHGHAHKGSPAGKTPQGIPVWNVSLPVLRRGRPDAPAFQLIDV